ncbi:MAG: TolC family protein [Candidatus Aminicenantaceae bacterium]
MNKRGKIILIIFLLFISCQFLISQEQVILTLEKTVDIALSQNPYHLASQERVDAAKARVREAAAQFFPSFNAQGTQTLDEKLFYLEFPSTIPGQPPQRVEVDFTRDYQFSFSLNIPLFTSGRLTSGFKQAKFNLLSSKENVNQSIQQTVFEAKKSFYGYLLAEKFVRVAEEAVSVARKHLDNVNSLYEVGMASKFDLLRSEVQVANLNPQLIQAKNRLEVAELGLKTLLGMDLSDPVEIKGELSYTPVEPDYEECLEKAYSNRPELKQINYQNKIARETLKMTRSMGLPSLSVAGNYNFWADKFNFKEDTWQDYYSVNLTLLVPIFNGFETSARLAQNRAMIEELKHTKKGLKDMIEFEVKQAILNLEEAKESILSQEKNVEQAEESLRIAELNYSEGLATTLDVSSAQAALTQAKTNYSQALYDYMVSLAQLDKAMGVGEDSQR